MIADPQVPHREMVASVAGLGPVLTIGSPIKLDGAPGQPVRPAPALGEHTDEVLTKLAGCAPERLDDLRARKVIG